MTVAIGLTSTTAGCGFHGKYLLVSKCEFCRIVARRLVNAGVTAEEWYRGTEWEIRD